VSKVVFERRPKKDEGRNKSIQAAATRGYVEGEIINKNGVRR